MDGLLVVALVGSLLFGCWLVFEVWVRMGATQTLPFTQKEERSGSEDTFWRVRVQVPASYRIVDKWVWISGKQYSALGDQRSLPVHVRHVGERTFVRGARHWGRVWLVGFLTCYFVFNLIAMVFDL